MQNAIVGTDGPVGRPYALCMRAATNTSAAAEIHLLDRHGAVYDVLSAPVDTTLRGLLGLYGLPGSNPVAGSDVDDPLDDAAKQHYDKVMAAAGAVVYCRTAPMQIGFGGTDDRAYANFVDPDALTPIALAVGQAVCAGAVPRSVRDAVAAGTFATSGNATLNTGGTAQDLFGGTVPPNGFFVFNNDPTEELWLCDSGTAAANGTGALRVGPLDLYETPPKYRPVGAVSWVAVTTGHKVTARYW